MQTVTYTCKLSPNLISFQLVGDVATIWEFEPDNNQIKLFFKLIKESIDNLIEKKIKYVRQIVGDDPDYYKNKKKWKILHTYPNSNLLIECLVDDFIDNFAEAIELHTV